MFSVRFTNLSGVQRSLASSLRSEVQALGKAVYQEIKQRTPVDTGRAKAGWRKQDQTNGFTISNQVPYIEVLDKGRHMTRKGMRGSKQAPRGIVGPSLESIKRKN